MSSHCIHRSKNRRVQSFLARLIAFGYSDGPTTGVAECALCGGSLHFAAVGWDSDQVRRLFAFQELPRGTFEKVADIIGARELPRWPVWVPRWSFESEDERRRVDADIDAAVASNTPSVAFVETEDLMGTFTVVLEADHVDVALLEQATGPNPDELAVFERWRQQVDREGLESRAPDGSAPRG